MFHPEPITLGPGRELLVRTLINDSPVMMQIDTGASATAVSPSTRRRLRLGGNLPTDGHGAGGALRDVRWARLQHMRLAGVKMPTYVVTVVDFDTSAGKVDGLLGMDVLGAYVFDVDLGARRLALYEDRPPREAIAGLTSHPYVALRGGQITLAVTVDGQPATAILDLGANRTFANLLVGLRVNDDDTTVRAAVGADRERHTFHTADHVAITLDHQPLNAETVWISELPIFAALGLAARPALILGTDALAGRRVVVDPFAHRVFISPPRPVRVSTPRSWR